MDSMGLVLDQTQIIICITSNLTSQKVSTVFSGFGVIFFALLVTEAIKFALLLKKI